MLSRRHGTKRVRASLVYNEFIAHKTHTHMNSTHWETLTSFVLYLGKVTVAVFRLGEHKRTRCSGRDAPTDTAAVDIEEASRAALYDDGGLSFWAVLGTH